MYSSSYSVFPLYYGHHEDIVFFFLPIVNYILFIVDNSSGLTAAG